jgi:hypothetical protein
VKVELQVDVLLPPVAKLQLTGLNVPSLGAILQVTEPVGDPLEPPVSFTVAAHVVDAPPTSTVVDVQEAIVVVASLASVKVFCAWNPEVPPVAIK